MVDGNIETFDMNEGETDFNIDDIMLNESDEVKSNSYLNNLKKPQTMRSINSDGKRLIKASENRLTDEEVEKKQKLIIMISRYKESPRFKSYLESLGFNLSPCSLKSKSIEDLEQLLQELKVSVSNKNSSSIVNEIYYLGTGIAEGVSQHPKIKDKCDLLGLTKNIKENEEIQDCIECLSLSYGDICSISPEKKIVMLTLSSALKTASINRMLKTLKDKNNPDIQNNNNENINENINQNVNEKKQDKLIEKNNEKNDILSFDDNEKKN